MNQQLPLRSSAQRVSFSVQADFHLPTVQSAALSPRQKPKAGMKKSVFELELLRIWGVS